MPHAHFLQSTKHRLGQGVGLDLLPPHERADTRTRGERLADGVTAAMGSWRFLLIQSAVLVAWVAANVVSGSDWDPYPFILLNLILSFQAAYAAPIIMMSQNRETAVDRGRAVEDYAVNLKAELEILALQRSLDAVRSEDLSRLLAAVARIEARLDASPPPHESV